MNTLIAQIMLPKSLGDCQPPSSAIPTGSSSRSPALCPQAEHSLQIEVKKVAMTNAKDLGQ